MFYARFRITRVQGLIKTDRKLLFCAKATRHEPARPVATQNFGITRIRNRLSHPQKQAQHHPLHFVAIYQPARDNLQQSVAPEKRGQQHTHARGPDRHIRPQERRCDREAASIDVIDDNRYNHQRQNAPQSTWDESRQVMRLRSIQDRGIIHFFERISGSRTHASVGVNRQRGLASSVSAWFMH